MQHSVWKQHYCLYTKSSLWPGTGVSGNTLNTKNCTMNTEIRRCILYLLWSTVFSLRNIQKIEISVACVPEASWISCWETFCSKYQHQMIQHIRSAIFPERNTFYGPHDESSCPFNDGPSSSSSSSDAGRNVLLRENQTRWISLFQLVSNSQPCAIKIQPQSGTRKKTEI